MPAMPANLSAADLEKLVQMVTAQAEVTVRADKRRDPRMVRDGTITIFPLKEGRVREPEHVRFRDISVRGIGLSHHTPMDIGSFFTVALVIPGKELAVFTYVVRRCHWSPDETYTIGGELVSVSRQAAGGGEPAAGQPAAGTQSR